MSLPSVNFQHLTVSEIYPGEDFIGQGHYCKVKGQVKVRHDVAHLHPLTNVPAKYQLSTPNGFRDIARTRFSNSGHYGKVKLRTNHNVAHLQPLTNVPTKYELPTPYSV